MKRTLKLFFVVAGILGYGLTAHAAILRPADMIPGLYGPSNCEPECVEATFGTSNLELLYKAEVGTRDRPTTAYSGSFAASYTTAFTNDPFDPQDALIEWIFDRAVIGCDECYLAVKDGNHTPGYYFYDLSGWDGMESIQLLGFWPDGGAISHVSIWGGGTATSVPEPGTLALLGLGLLGFGLVRRGVTAY